MRSSKWSPAAGLSDGIGAGGASTGAFIAGTGAAAGVGLGIGGATGLGGSILGIDGLAGADPKRPSGSSSIPFPMISKGETPPLLRFLQSGQRARPVSVSRQSTQKGFWHSEQAPAAFLSGWMEQATSGMLVIS